MKLLSVIAAAFVALVLAGPAHAHRTTGLLQASLVDVLPSQVGVEVTLTPGIDIAPKIFALLDMNGDGVVSEIESAVWSEIFMAGQSVAVDGKLLPLTVQSVRTSPLAEMTNGHAEIVVNFTADLGELTRGPHTIVCANHYEPIPSAYQVNGLVPKAPSVRITSHCRDEGQNELTLKVESSSPAKRAAQGGYQTDCETPDRP